MKKKFSTMLLTGKAASLLMMVQQANAASITPYYTDILSTQLTQIEVPVSNVISLNSLGTPPAISTPGTYDTGGSATICTSSSLPNTMSIVITGLQNGDNLMLVTATSKGGYESLHSRILIGGNNLTIPVSTVVSAPSGGTIALSVPLNLTDLQNKGYNLSSGQKFYIQSVVFPAGGLVGDWASARISELDTISIGTCSTSTYGGTTY